MTDEPEVPSPAPIPLRAVPQAPTDKPSPAQRAEQCMAAIQNALEAHGCTIVAAMQPEPVGTPAAPGSFPKMLVSAGWYIRPIALLALLLLGVACAGMEPARLANERAALALMIRLRDGWFHAQPAPSERDQQLVNSAIADWERALAAEAAAAGGR